MFPVLVVCYLATICVQDWGGPPQLCRIVRAILLVIMILALFGVLGD